MSKTQVGKQEITVEKDVPAAGLEGRLASALKDPKVLWFYAEREDPPKPFQGQAKR